MKEILTKEKNGLTFQSEEGNGMENGNMENIQALLLKLITPETTFIDLGAHIGTMSIPVIVQAKPKRSILIEANPQVIPLLEANCAANLTTPYEVLNRAVCDTDEMVDFNVCEKADSSSMARTDLKGLPKTPVQGLTLNTLLRDIDGDIILKVDIELAELLMWKGMKEVKHKPRAMVLEWFVNGMDPGQAEELISQIRGDGWHLHTLEGQWLEDRDLLKMGKEDLWLRNHACFPM